MAPSTSQVPSAIRDGPVVVSFEEDGSSSLQETGISDLVLKRNGDQVVYIRGSLRIEKLDGRAISSAAWSQGFPLKFFPAYLFEELSFHGIPSLFACLRIEFRIQSHFGESVGRKTLGKEWQQLDDGFRQWKALLPVSYARRWSAKTMAEVQGWRAEIQEEVLQWMRSTKVVRGWKIEVREAAVKAKAEAKVDADAKLLGWSLSDSARQSMVLFLVRCVYHNCADEEVDVDLWGDVHPSRDNGPSPSISWHNLLLLFRGTKTYFEVLILCFWISISYGTKTYSPGSLEFRATYVSLLLFQGSYVWIKFRDRGHASEGYLYWRDKEKRWEPRYAPLGTGRLSLGSYKKEDDAKVVLQVAQFYFEAKERVVDFRNGFKFPIPPLSEQMRNSSVMEKRKWVPEKARLVLKDYNRRKQSRGLVGTENSADDISRKMQVSQRDPRFISDPPPSDHGESPSDSGEKQTPRLPRDDIPNSLDLGPVLGTGTSDRSEKRGTEQVLVQEEHKAGRDVPIVGVGVLGPMQLQLEWKEEGTVAEHPLKQQNFILTELVVKGLRAGSTRSDWDTNCLLKSIYEQVKILNGGPTLEPSLRLDGESMNDELSSRSELESEQPQVLLSQQPREQQDSGKLPEREQLQQLLLSQQPREQQDSGELPEREQLQQLLLSQQPREQQDPGELPELEDLMNTFEPYIWT